MKRSVAHLQRRLGHLRSGCAATNGQSCGSRACESRRSLDGGLRGGRSHRWRRGSRFRSCERCARLSECGPPLPVPRCAPPAPSACPRCFLSLRPAPRPSPAACRMSPSESRIASSQDSSELPKILATISILASRARGNIQVTACAYNAPSHYSVPGCSQWPARGRRRNGIKRGTAEQWIKGGKQGNLWRQLVLPRRIDGWLLTSL